MKIRPLPEIDLARIAPLPQLRQRELLNQVKFGRPQITYRPFRSNIPDIVNEQPAMFGPSAPTPWSRIKTEIGKVAKWEKELEANVAVAKCLFEFCHAREVIARRQDFIPLSLSLGIKVRYWSPTLLIYGDRAVVPFFDPRRSRGLTKLGRKFVFSMMHERIRVASPDFSSVQLGIFQFGDAKADARKLKLHIDHEIELFRAEELEAMINATYALWIEVLEGRRDEERRRGGGSGGLL